MNKGFAPILVLLAVVLVGGVGVGWYLSNTGVIPKFTGPATTSQSPAPDIEQPSAPPEVPEAEETEEGVVVETISYKENPSWQTYTNAEKKFSVQYPSTSKIDTQTNERVVFLSCGNYPPHGDLCLRGYSITVYDDYDGRSRREWLLRKFPDLKTYPLYYEEFVIQGKKSLLVGTADTGSNNDVFILIPNGKMMYVYNAPGSANKATLVIDKERISTFRLLP